MKTESIVRRGRAARAEAFAEAKACSPWVFSRGSFVATVAENGDQCDPWPSADAMRWDGKLSSLPKLVTEATRHPNVWLVVVEGGYDGADTMKDKKAGVYDPWIASWQVVLWDRRDGGR